MPSLGERPIKGNPMSREQYAARLVMVWLAEQPSLYGAWMEPEWRTIWNELRRLARF